MSDNSKIKDLQTLVKNADKILLKVWQKCDQTVDDNGKPFCEEEFEWARIVMKAQRELNTLQAQLRNTSTGGKK